VLHRRATAGDVATVVAWSVLVGLPVGPLWWRLDTWWRERQPMGGPTERAAREDVESARQRRTVHLVQQLTHDQSRPAWVRKVASLRAVPPIDAGTGVLLGRKLAGDLDWDTGPRGAVVLPEPPTVRHLCFLGETGCGKSEAVFLKVEYDMARPGKRHVIHINCKEPGHGPGSSERLAKMAADAGRTSMRLEHGASPYDPMRGTAKQIHQRLMAAEEWSEPWYQHLASVVLALALELAEREGHPPESLGELVKDLLQGGLANLARDDERAAEALELIEKNDSMGLATRLMDQALQLAGWVGPATAGGWGWEDAEVIGVDLPTSTEPGAARMLLRLMLTDLAGWMTDQRRPMLSTTKAVPLTLVLEEIGALDGDPILAQRIVNLMERARSSEVEVVLVAHTPLSLGDPRAQEAILSHTTVITGTQVDQDAVERLAALAGTEVGEEGSVAYQPGTDTVAGSIRAQHVYKVNPNTLRQLSRGELVIMHHGRFAKVAITMGAAGYGTSSPTAIEAGRPDELSAGTSSRDEDER